MLFWVLVAGFLYVFYKNYKKDVENMKKNTVKEVENAVDESRTRELIEEVKKRIITETEKGNADKVNQLTQLWLKKENELPKKSKNKSISYKVGSALSGVLSSFKEGLNQE